MTSTLPNWDLSFILPSPASQAAQERVSQIASGVQKLGTKVNATLGAGHISVPALAEALQLAHSIWDEFQEIRTYCQLNIANDSKDEASIKLRNTVDKALDVFKSVLKPLEIYVQKLPEKAFRDLISQPEMKGKEFYYADLRKWTPYLLSLQEENLLLDFRGPGIRNWEALHSELCSSIRVKVEGLEQEMGFAQAYGMRSHPDPETRKNVYAALNRAFEAHKDTIALCLNNIFSWKIKENKRRTRKQSASILSFSCLSERIQEKTLDTMVDEILKFGGTVRAASKSAARYLGQEKLNYWDLLAGFKKKGHSTARVSYKEGMNIIRKSTAEIHPEFNEFIDFMEQNQLISAQLLPHKAGGAFCASLYKAKKPAVFMSYTEDMNSTLILGHELGHAYHAWVMKELQSTEQEYCSSVAETASIFFETVIQNYLLNTAETTEQRLEILWEQYQAAATYIIDIPTRFLLEKELFKRIDKEFLTADEISQLYTAVSQETYADSIESQDSLFWAQKMHFYMEDMSYYNFPYSFGYLFSLGVYAQKEKMGEQFYQNYKNLLMDTGRMNTEDLAQKHLGVDITQPQFWRDSLAVVAQQLVQFQEALAEYGSLVPPPKG